MSLPEPRWAIPGLFAEGLNILAGKPKTGKSWLALAIAHAVASGAMILDKKVEIGEVLYLALEDTWRRLQDRLRKLHGATHVSSGLHFAHEWERLKRGGMEGLEHWIGCHPACRLVIIDTLTRIRPPRVPRADSYEEDSSLGSMLQSLGHKHHLAVVVVHHTRKAKASDIFDTVHGSTGLTGAADSIAVLTRNRGAREGLLSITGRDIDEEQIKLSFDETSCEWTVSETDGASLLSVERIAILDLLSKAERPLSPKQIADACGLPHGSVKHLVRDLAIDKSIVSHGDGRYSSAERSVS